MADLFDRLLHQSGLAYRELFLSASERRLTNYLHIFEILLARANANRLALPEIIALLEDYVSERALPEVEDGNVQRLESERDAVSVITVHMSKGLEAGVVVLFGGLGKPQDPRDSMSIMKTMNAGSRSARSPRARSRNTWIPKKKARTPCCCMWR